MIFNFGEQNGYKVRSSGHPLLAELLRFWMLGDSVCSLLVFVSTGTGGGGICEGGAVSSPPGTCFLGL